VSRSFFRTLRDLPRSLRRPLGLAYLLARAADTIADARLISRDARQAHLERFRAILREEGQHLEMLPIARAAVRGAPADGELLDRLPEALAMLQELAPAERARVRGLLLTLTQAMLFDLTTFPGEDEGRLLAVRSRETLGRYTYLVAGCVGEFWTEMALDHRPALAGWDRDAMRRRGVRFGQGLQLTNILRDLPRDLRIGRCYLPSDELSALGLDPEDLLDPSALVKLRPLLVDLLRETLAHYEAGWAYTRALPPGEWRLRLACAWPLLIGLKTLARVAATENLLDPAVTVKITRGEVYRILGRSAVVVGFDRAFTRYYRGLHHRVAEYVVLESAP
jgi:farnesyl-diphosphate farnesyltransferase